MARRNKRQRKKVENNIVSQVATQTVNEDEASEQSMKEIAPVQDDVLEEAESETDAPKLDEAVLEEESSEPSEAEEVSEIEEAKSEADAPKLDEAVLEEESSEPSEAEEVPEIEEAKSETDAPELDEAALGEESSESSEAEEVSEIEEAKSAADAPKLDEAVLEEESPESSEAEEGPKTEEAESETDAPKLDEAILEEGSSESSEAEEGPEIEEAESETDALVSDEAVIGEESSESSEAEEVPEIEETESETDALVLDEAVLDEESPESSEGESNSETEVAALKNIEIPQEENEGEEEKANTKKKRHSFTFYFFLFTIVVVVGSVGSIVWMFQSSGTSIFSTRPDVDLPNFYNMERSEIEGNELYQNFRIVYQEVYNGEFEEGTVFDQSPKAPKQVKENAQIIIFVSKGVEMVQVPDIAGWTKTAGSEKVKSVGLNILFKTEDSNTVPAGKIIRTVPAASVKVEAGQTITVYISKPKEDTFASVPSCIGLSQTSAMQLVSGNKLSPMVVMIASDSPKNYVVRQSPAAGTALTRGDRVTLYIASGITEEEQAAIDATINTGGSGHIHDWSVPDAEGWRFCYVCLEREHVVS